MTNTAFIANGTRLGGGNRSLILLAEGLRERWREVTLVMPDRGPLFRECEARGIDSVVHEGFQPSWRQPVRSWRETRWWERFLGDRGVDVLHANDPVVLRPALLGARSRGVTTLAHVRYPPHADVSRWVFRGLPKPAGVIFNSEALRDEVGADLRRAGPRSRQFVVHNAVNLEEFRPRSVSRGERTRIGMLAHLVPDKGHLDLLAMAAELTHRGIDAEFWLIGAEIAGSGYEGVLRGRASELGLDDRVRFLGHRNDVPELLAALDVVVCASHVEPFGRCVAEALACERPVVATRVGGIPEIVEHEVHGLLVPPGSPDRLSEAVARLLQDSTLAATLAENGRRRTIEAFSAEGHVERILEIHDELRVGDGAAIPVEPVVGVTRSST